MKYYTPVRKRLGGAAQVSVVVHGMSGPPIEVTFEHEVAEGAGLQEVAKWTLAGPGLHRMDVRGIKELWTLGFSGNGTVEPLEPKWRKI